jgi:hypothetical protein
MAIFNRAIRGAFDPMRTVTAATIVAGAGGFVTIGAVLANGARAFYILNDTDGTITFSIDGVNDHFLMITDSYILFDVSSNQSFSQGFFLPVNTQFWARQNVLPNPTTGSVYLTILYGAD